MSAASLLVVLVVAKAIALIGHPLPLSPWTPFAFFWQDVLLAVAFALVELAAPAAVTRGLYVAIVAYVAINVPITLTLGSPLTWTMWRAARGAMSDSAVHELTTANVAAIAAVVASAASAPRILRAMNWRPGWRSIGAALAFVAVGIAGTGRIDTGGRHRNAIGALAPLSVPVLEAAMSDGDLRRSPFPSPAGEDLTHLRGVARGMNVVVIVLESAAAQDLRPYGAPADPMPVVSAIAGQSVVFDSAYAVYPESIKELFATLCATPPAFNAPAENDAAMPCASIAATLHARGYRTSLFHSGRFDYLGMREVVTGRGFDTVEDAAAIGGVVHSSFGVDEGTTVARALGWIDAGGTREPFFLAYLPIAGHHPYATRGPGPFDGRTPLTQHLNALHEADAAVGQLVEGLRSRGLDERTMLVVYGDHGEAFGQHDGNSGHSLFIYDENVRVPLMIRVPGHTAARVQRPVSVVDLAPTILDLLAQPGAATSGASMLDPTARLALFFTDYSQGWVGLRDGCRKYLLDIDANRSRLFDVCRDPGETADRSAAEPERVAAYRARVLQWLAAGQAALTRSVRPPSGSS